MLYFAYFAYFAILQVIPRLYSRWGNNKLNERSMGFDYLFDDNGRKSYTIGQSYQI